MFKKNHVGRPSNDEIRARKIKKLVVIGIPVAAILIVSILISTGNLSKLRGDSVTNNSNSSDYVISGDFNLDGKVNWDDYNLLAKYNTAVFNGQDVSGYSENQLRAGDVSNNGMVYLADQTMLERYLNNKENSNIGKEVCGYYYESTFVNNKYICEKKGSETYKSNNKNNSTYSVTLDFDCPASRAYNVAYPDILSYTSRAPEEPLQDKNLEVKYNSSINVRQNPTSKNGYCTFDKRIAEYRFYGFDSETKYYLCYMNNGYIGYVDKNTCERNGYVPISSNSKRLNEPPYPIYVVEKYNADKYLIRYKSTRYTPVDPDDVEIDKDTVVDKYVKKGDTVNIENPKIVYSDKDYNKIISEGKFLGWTVQLINFDLEEHYYCYKDAGKTTKGWTSLKECEKNGYVLLKAGNNTNFIKPTQFVQLSPVWEGDIYYITFDSNGGTRSMNDVKVKNDSSFTIPSNKFEKPGYTFTGWYAENNNFGYCYTNPAKTSKEWTNKNNCISFGYVLLKDEATLKNFNSNLDLLHFIAQWKKNVFYVEYNSNATGTSGRMSRQEIIFGNSTALNYNNFVRDKYKFTGWRAYNKTKGKWICKVNGKQGAYTKSECDKDNSYVIFKDGQNVAKTGDPNETIVMYAQWKKNTFIIKFNGNSATSGSMSDQEVTYGKNTQIKANSFKKDKYKFIGWRVYNQTRNKWACEYFNNGNKVKGYASASDCKSYINYRDKQTISKTANPGETIIMYAQWELKPFTIKFNGNSSTSGSMSNQEVTYGKETKIKANAFRRSGYVFDGWYVYNESRGKWACKYYSNGSLIQGYAKKQNCVKYVRYSDKQTISKTAEAGETIRMYAQWKKNTFIIKFNGSYATSGSMSNQEVAYGKNTQIKANAFRKSGYVFDGWYVFNETKNKWACKYYSNGILTQGYAKEQDCVKRVKYSDKQIISKTAEAGEKIRMDAQWKKNTFKIIFNGNSATRGSMTNQEVTYGKDTKIKANSFKKDKYKFTGWRVYNQTNNKWACKYYSNGILTQGYAAAYDCNSYVNYRDKQTISKTANPGETIIMYAQWEKLTCVIQYKCSTGTKIGDGPHSTCKITIGSATKKESYHCPKSYMHKDSNSKCSYSATYITSNYYSCPDGGSLSGNKCYVGTKKTTSYHCTSGYRDGKRCYRDEPTKTSELCT